GVDAGQKGVVVGCHRTILVVPWWRASGRLPGARAAGRARCRFGDGACDSRGMAWHLRVPAGACAVLKRLIIRRYQKKL
ncbi:MAG: hypothetical protein KDH91_09005, partial [Rhodoferax sp.]|nr:hypothetical protein [Rhodoferax sp.]